VQKSWKNRRKGNRKIKSYKKGGTDRRREVKSLEDHIQRKIRGYSGRRKIENEREGCEDLHTLSKGKSRF